MPILLKTEIERTAKTPVTARRARVGGLCLFRHTAERVPIQQFYEQKLAKLDAECEQERIRKRLEAFQLAQQETARPPA